MGNTILREINRSGGKYARPSSLIPLDAFLEREKKVEALLRADLEREHGITGHPKAELLWNLATHQHPRPWALLNLVEVVDYYDKNVELIK